MDHRGLKVLVHASTWFAPVILPIIVFLIISDRDVKRISLQAFFFHILMVVLIAVTWFLSFVLIGIPFFILFSLMAIYYPIKGIIYALQDRKYEYPIVNWFIH